MRNDLQQEDPMFTTYLLVFCRVTIALLFIFSFCGKLLALRDFAVTIGDFKLLPRKWSKGAAILFLIGEITTAILVTMDVNLTFIGFLLAITLLMIFSVALVTALWRKLDMSCNCFGRTEQRISHYDVIRNGIFILCGLIGLWLLRYAPQGLSVSEIILLALMSTVFLLFIVKLDDIVETLRQPFPNFEERR